MIRDDLIKHIGEILSDFTLSGAEVLLEHPADLSHGDYATNVALVAAKEAGKNPHDLAESIAAQINENKPESVERVEALGPGFINFHLSRDFFAESLAHASKKEWGNNTTLANTKVMVEYTDPNPFKEMHIGHVMSNTIGESISRLVECSGAEVKRANYQGDMGLHVAKAIWGLQKTSGQTVDAARIGAAYAEGARAYEEGEQAKNEIEEINRKLYAGKDEPEVNELYKEGRRVSLDHFEEIYQKLGTKFDYYFFESETGPLGKQIVHEHVNGVFEKSDGAVVFRGEKHGLHTRVFLTSEELPTYEAKDLGLVVMKADTYPSDLYITITASEQTDYFRVVKKALELMYPDLAEKVVHIAHGMMRLSGGKMSSRTGDVVTAETLLNSVIERVNEKMKDTSMPDVNTVSEHIAVGAIKYSILKQSAGKDIVFDFEKSLSFEGDSGPYLMYSHARARSVLEKARAEGISPDTSGKKPAVSEVKRPAVSEVERLLYRFPEVVERAMKEYEPHYVATFLTELAGSFNSYYAKEKIIDGSPEAPYKLALTDAFAETMKNGLWLLGIEAPEKM